MTKPKFDPDGKACPECGSSWLGEKIPEKSRHLYAGTSEHFSRLIGMELGYDQPGRYDGVSIWGCPDCTARWDRWTRKLITNEKP